MGNMPVKFRDHGCKGIAVMCRKPFPKSMHYDLDLWTFGPEINRAHPWLMESLPVKFRNHRYKGIAVMRQKPFSVIHALWPWPIDPEINRAHPWLRRSVPVKFCDHGCKGKAVMRRKPFPEINALWPWPLTLKSTGHILASWRVCMWSFMMIGVKGKQLCAGNHFQ